MISNQILQNTLDGIKGITKNDLCIMDTEGNALAYTSDDFSELAENGQEFVRSAADSQSLGGCQYFKIYEEDHLEYVVAIRGDSEEIYTIGKMVVFQIQSLLVAYRERYDKDNFIKNLLLDNLLMVDIFNRAKKLHIEINTRRVVYIIETNREKDTGALDTVSSMFATQTQDFITAVDEKNIILVEEVSEKETITDLEKTAKVIVDMLNTEAMSKVHVAFGTIVKELKDVSRSYKEAKMALDVGKIFYMEKPINAYNTLGIGRLIYQLPVNLCRIFMKEIFGDNIPDDLDEEVLTTVQKFFDNNLNVSETSRQLFVHRNTLVYRIEKLHQSTGLDIRKFDDALTFKIALMVVNYMKYIDSLE